MDCKRPVVTVDRKVIPLSVIHSAANVHDHQGPGGGRRHYIEPIYKPRGRARKRPQMVYGYKDREFPRYRRVLTKTGIIPRIARRGIDSSEKLGRYRWAVG